MAQYSQEQADALLAKGAISPETHQLMMGSAYTAYDDKGKPYEVDAGAQAASAAQTGVGQINAPTGPGGATIGALPLPPAEHKQGFSQTVKPVPDAAPMPAASPMAMIGPPGPVPPLAPEVAVPKVFTNGPPSSHVAPQAAEPSRDAVANGQGIPKAPAAPEGPSRDPRVNKRIAQYEKQYAPVRDAQDREVEAAGEVVRREGERDDKLAQNSNEFVMRSSIMQAEGARDEQNYQAESAAQRERIKLASDDAAKSKVNANAFWDNKGTAEKIAGVLAIGLGAVGASLARTDNFALSMINAAISRDIAAQEKNLDGKWKKVDSERGVLSDLRSVYGDKRIARSDAYAAAYKQTIAQGDAIAANAKSDVAKANWEQLRAGLEVKIKQHDFEVLQGMEAQQKQADAAAGAAMRARDAENRKFFMEQYGKTLDASRKELQDAASDGRAPAPWAVQTAQAAAAAGVQMPSGDSSVANGVSALAGIPKDEHVAAIKEREDRAKAEATASKLRGLYAEYRKLPGTAGPWDRDRERIQAGIATEIKKGAGPGMSSDQDREAFILPVVPKYGEFDETLKNKEEQAISGVLGSAPTPTWDRYKKSATPGETAPKPANTAGFTGVK